MREPRTLRRSGNGPGSSVLDPAWGRAPTLADTIEHDRPLAVVGCSQLVTLAGPARPRIGKELGELSIMHDGAMLVREGRIELVGARSTLESQIGAEYEVVDAGGRVVLPGFVDAHTHPVFAGTRADEYEQRANGATYQEIAAAGGGIRSTVRKTR